MGRHIGVKIQRLRQRRGMSVSLLAKRSGLSVAYIHLIEAGKNFPTLANVEKLAVALAAELSFEETRGNNGRG